MGNPLVHFEFAGRNGDTLERFYGGLFDWQLNRTEAGGFPYGRIDTGGPVDGAVRHEPEGHAEVVMYFGVDDLDGAVARAERLGGKVRIPPMETPDVTFALISDPEGNPVGLVKNK